MQGAASKTAPNMNTNGSIENAAVWTADRVKAWQRGGAVPREPDYDRRLISWAIFASCTRIFSSSA